MAAKRATRCKVPLPIQFSVYWKENGSYYANPWEDNDRHNADLKQVAWRAFHYAKTGKLPKESASV